MFLSLTFVIILKSPVLSSKFYNYIFEDYYEMFKKVADRDKIIRSNQHFAHYYTAMLIFNENKIFGSGIKLSGLKVLTRNIIQLISFMDSLLIHIKYILSFCPNLEL